MYSIAFDEGLRVTGVYVVLCEWSEGGDFGKVEVMLLEEIYPVFEARERCPSVFIVGSEN